LLFKPSQSKNSGVHFELIIFIDQVPRKRVLRKDANENIIKLNNFCHYFPFCQD